MFSEEDKSEREYTSITINAKEDNASDDTTEDAAPAEESDKETASEESLEESKEYAASEEITETSQTEESDVTYTTDAVIPTIDFGTSKASDDEPEVLGYENEGLSDVSEDPDVLEEQDKLDF